MTREVSLRRLPAAMFFCAMGLLWPIHGALAQAKYQGMSGVTGRYFDPGQMRSPGSLSPIGGFARVAGNPTLESVKYGPQAPIGVMRVGLLDPMSRDRHRAGMSSSLDTLYGAGSSYRYATSMSDDPSIRQPGYMTGARWQSRMESWNDRGLSAIGQQYAGGGVRFEPVTPRTRYTRANTYSSTNLGNLGLRGWQGGRTYSGASLRNLLGMGGPRLGAGSSLWQPSNKTVWQEAEVAVRRERQASPTTRPQPSPGTVSVEQLVSRVLNERYEGYVRRGWELFGRRQYSDAYNSFSLADTVRPNAPEAQIGLIYSAIATSRYIAASNAMTALLRQDPAGGQSWLPLVEGIRERYGRGEELQREATLHWQQLEDYTKVNPGPGVAALNALVQWGRGDRSQAQFTAQAVAERTPSGSVYWKLADAMKSLMSKDSRPPESSGPRG